MKKKLLSLKFVFLDFSFGFNNGHPQLFCSVKFTSSKQIIKQSIVDHIINAQFKT